MEKEDDKNQAADERMEQQERLRALYKAMDKLPQKQKTALTLNKMEALSYKEIAGIMDISVSETGVLINRAKKKLQQKLVDRFKNM
jgi:RNA polymerase sigma-70 factor (ECF subfamily)